MRPDPRARGGWLDRVYLGGVCKGLGVTVRHFARNLAVHLAHRVGLLRGVRAAVTVQYPEETRPLAPRHRSRHRLVRRDDGSPRCVACMLCPTICPARCIHVRAGEHPDPAVEKYPVEFTVVLDRCVMCGLCVEACPVDAIRMDTAVVTFAAWDREELVLRRDLLLQGEPAQGASTASEALALPSNELNRSKKAT